MIEGIQIDIPTVDVRAHVRERIAYHEKKARFYNEQALALIGGGGSQQNVSNDPVSSLQHSAERHQERITFFKVIEKYLVPDEIYRLTETDLVRLEFAPSRY